MKEGKVFSRATIRVRVTFRAWTYPTKRLTDMLRGGVLCTILLLLAAELPA